MAGPVIVKVLNGTSKRAISTQDVASAGRTAVEGQWVQSSTWNLDMLEVCTGGCRWLLARCYPQLPTCTCGNPSIVCVSQDGMPAPAMLAPRCLRGCKRGTLIFPDRFFRVTGRQSLHDGILSNQATGIQLLSKYVKCTMSPCRMPLLLHHKVFEELLQLPLVTMCLQDPLLPKTSKFWNSCRPKAALGCPIAQTNQRVAQWRQQRQLDWSMPARLGMDSQEPPPFILHFQ